MKLSLKSKVRQSNQVVSHEFDGVVYILDPEKNTVRALNDTAGFIWNSIKRRQAAAAAAAAPRPTVKHCMFHAAVDDDAEEGANRSAEENK